MIKVRRKTELGCRFSAPDLNLDFIVYRLRATQKDSYSPNGVIEDPLTALAHSNTPGTEDIVAVGSDEGYIHIVNTCPSSPVNCMDSWQAHANVIFDVCWFPNFPVILSASGDQQIVAWDVRTRVAVSTFCGHKSSIKTVACHPESTGVFASGSRDGNIMIWDTRDCTKENYHSAINIIQGAHRSTCIGPPKTKQKKSNAVCLNPSWSVSAILFQDLNTVVSAGASDGCIKVWDLRKPYSAFKKEPQPCHKIPYAGKSAKTHGYTSLVFEKGRKRLFANCTDDMIYQFDASSYKNTPISTYCGHQSDSYFTKISLSSDGRYLASGSKDCQSFIWRITQSGSPIASLNGHAADVSVATWHPTDLTRIVTCCDDGKFLRWQVGEDISSEAAFSSADLIGRAEKFVPLETTVCNDCNDDDCSVVLITGEKTPSAMIKTKCQDVKAGRKKLVFQRTENVSSSSKLKRRLFRGSKRARNSTEITKQAAMFKNYFSSSK